MVLDGKGCQHNGREHRYRQHCESLEGLHHWRCHCCYRKNHQAQNNKIPARENCVQMLCMSSQDLQQSQVRRSWKRYGGWGQRRRGEVQGFKIGILEKFRSWCPHTWGTNISQFDGDKCFWTSARQWGRRHRRSSARKWMMSDNLAEGFRIFKTAFDLFYDMDPSLIWAFKPKQTVEEGLVALYGNIFREI